MKAKLAVNTLALAALVASVGFTPAALCAQRPGGGPGGPGGMMQQNSVEFLISQSEALALTSEQEEALEKIAIDLSVAMEPIREEMMAARDGGGGREAMMAVREKIMVADDEAVDHAMEVLDTDQTEVAKKLLADRPRRRRPGGG